jgi:hypothetical protein
MGYKPIPTNKWRKWLKKRGLVYVRTHASHEVWDYPDDSTKSILQPVIFRGAKKEIPGCHIHTNLQTLGIKYEEFIKELNNL